MTFAPLVSAWLLVPVVALLAAVTITALVRSTSAAERLGWVRRTAIVAVVGLMGAGPSTATSSLDTTVAAVDVYFVVDRTGSMAAEDWGPEQDAPRLDGVRHDVTALAESVGDGRFAVIAYDSQATRQLPLTWDRGALGSWAQSVTHELTDFSQGSLVDRPLDDLAAALEGSREQNPANMRVVYFLTDGEQTAGGEPRSFADLAPLIDAGAVLGYGTTDGGRMLESTPAGVGPGYIQDPAGGDGLSVADPTTLQALADELGLPYVHRTGPDDVAALVDGIDPAQVAADGRREVTTYRPVVWPLALVLGALLAGEAGAWSRAVARTVPARRRTGAAR
ncbi:VWA domain-containing protein [Isoptericola halotolerans]|uniref:Ca-activated chloride channel family protein n=1 Tax=Isoptericola halotolerans TaxID=300560 RepID=A0ABX1ZYQ8_9MICO|nr:VWA domain-containing protein [Isoptericola halotolerans]NOV95742.1 Ca-activated chloride channel family protein [Isoptericola halotolerans]